MSRKGDKLPGQRDYKHPVKAAASAGSSNKQKQFTSIGAYSLFIVCISLSVWSITIYRSTFIDWKVLITPTIAGAIVTCLLLFKRFKILSDYVWTPMLLCLISGGCLFHFLFMATNKYLMTDVRYYDTTLMIAGKGRLATGKNSGCSSPFVLIDFNGSPKQIVFSCQDEEQVSHADSLHITYRQGLWGYFVLEAKELR